MIQNSFRNNLEILLVMSYMDLKQKYQNSALGFLWSFLKPFLQFVAYFVIFAKILHVGSGINYALKLFYGVLVWSWFSEGTSLGFISYIEKKSIVTKIKVNRMLPPLAAYTTQTMNYFLNLLIFLILYAIGMKSFPPDLFSLHNFLIFLFSMGTISLLIISLNLVLACLNVLYRDIRPIWELVLSYGIFATPVIYHIPVPERFKLVYYAINLLALPLETLKSIFFTEQEKTYQNPEILLTYVISLSVLCILSAWIYKKLNSKIIDYL